MSRTRCELDSHQMPYLLLVLIFTHSTLPYLSFCFVFRKGLIYLDIPIYDHDYIYVSTLEGFVMNRVMGDYLEKLLYKILVSIDQQTSVGEVFTYFCSTCNFFTELSQNFFFQLATLLQIDSNSVKKAVALFCRLNLAKKKNVVENTHPSWNEIRGSPETNCSNEKK